MWAGDSTALDGSFGDYSAGLEGALIAISAMTWYNSIEMLLLVFVVFKKYKGLYFWSLILTSFSIIPYQIGAMFKLIFRKYNVLSTIFLNTGWIVMIVGQSVVLYSRLHLVTQNTYLLKFIRNMIIGTAIFLCIPTTVATYGSNLVKSEGFINGYAIIEKVQMTLFTLQEFVISSTYLWRVRDILTVAAHQRQRRILYELVIINVIIIMTDVVLLTMEYRNAYQVEIVLKGFIYSIKLKLELGVLSKLVRTVSGREFQNGILARVGDNFPLEGDRFHLGILAANLQDPLRKTPVHVSSSWAGAAIERERKGSEAIVSPRVAAACADISGKAPSPAAHRGLRSMSASRGRYSVDDDIYSIDRIADLPEHSSVDPEGPSAVLGNDSDSMIPLTPQPRSAPGSPFGAVNDDISFPGRL